MAFIKEVEGFTLAFSTTEDGNMARTQMTRQEVHVNRTRFFGTHVPTASRLVRIRPSHSANVDLVRVPRASQLLHRTTFYRQPWIDTDFDFYYDGSDGVIATDENVCISLIAGDCIPLIFWKSQPRCFGILHIGLMGALNNMVAGLELALASLDLTPADMRYYLGPSISQAEYDISKSGLWVAIEEQVKAHPVAFDQMRPFLSRSMNFDMKGLVRSQLATLDVPPSSIDGYPVSTADPESPFFSHYAAIQKGGVPQNFCSLLCPTR